MFVVKEKIVWDGMEYGILLTTSFKYEMGFYFAIDKTVTPHEKIREFQGFYSVNEVAPTGDYTTTAYYVGDHYLAGMPGTVTTYNAYGKVFTQTVFSYFKFTPTQRGIPSVDPKVIMILPDSKITKIWDGSPTMLKCTVSLNNYQFNDSGSPGNLSLIQAIDKGEVDSSLDDIGYDYVNVEKYLF